VRSDVQHWLYPLSSTSDFWFVLPDGTETQDTSPANFEKSVLREGSDDCWTVASNYRRIGPGDRVWVYYGRADGDLGVVGLATVRDVTDPEDGRADIELRWDKAATRRLLIDPVPASEVRRYLRPRAAVANMAPHTALVNELLERAGRGKGRAPRKAAPKARSSTITYSPPASVTVRRRHDALIDPVRTRLETSGWSVDPFDVNPRRVDLAMRKGRHLLLMEFKTFNASPRAAVREAFAQLHEYRWRYERAHPSLRRTIHPWSIFERRPDDDDVAFLEAFDVLVSWADRSRRRMTHGDRTLPKLRSVGVAT
jgi:hypothetical protein